MGTAPTWRRSKVRLESKGLVAFILLRSHVSAKDGVENGASSRDIVTAGCIGCDVVDVATKASHGLDAAATKKATAIRRIVK